MDTQLTYNDIERIFLILSDVLYRRASGGLGPAPEIDQWVPVRAGSNYRLWGQVSGHPRGLAGDVMTSPLFYLDPATGLARTKSRWYRLGTALRADNTLTDGILVFGPDSWEVTVEAAVARLDLMPDLVLEAAKVVGDETQIQRAMEIKQKWHATG